MKWIEIIELQSVDCNRELLESQLQQLINEVEKETNKQTITAYNRVLIDNDFSIHLIHNSKKAERTGSQLGLRLSLALKEFGLVNHSVWVEMQSK